MVSYTCEVLFSFIVSAVFEQDRIVGIFVYEVPDQIVGMNDANCVVLSIREDESIVLLHYRVG